MFKHFKPVLGITVILMVVITFLASNFYKLGAQSDKANNEKPTIVSRSKAVTEEERAYSLEYKKKYKESFGNVNKLLEAAKRAGTKEIVGASLNEGSRPELPGDIPSASRYLARLSCESDIIVIGMVMDKQAHLTEDKSFVYTQYQFAISDILKNNEGGSLNIGEEIQVTRPGGFISLENQLIKIEDQSYSPLNIGAKYLLFLKLVPSVKGFMPAQVEGTFDLTEEAVKQLNGRRLAELNNISPDGLADSIRISKGGGCKNDGRLD